MWHRIFSRNAGVTEVLALIDRGLQDAGGYPDRPAVLDGGKRVLWTLGDLRWSDGHPVTAEDVRACWELYQDGPFYLEGQNLVEQVESLTVTGTRTYEIHWKEVNRFSSMDFPALPAHAFKPPNSREAMPGTPVGVGPFRRVGWSPGTEAVFEPNPHWHGSGPHLNQVVVRFFGSSEALELAVRNGEVDALGEASGLAIDRVVRLAEDLEDREAVVRPGGTWLHLEVRLDHPVLARRGTRQAVAAAIDRNRLAQVVYGGAGRPAFGLFPRFHAGYRTRPADWTPEVPFQPGDPRQLRLQYAAGSAAAELAGTVLQQDLQKLGFRVELDPVPFRTLFERMERKEHGELVLFAWNAGPDWDGRSVLHQTGRQNYGGYGSPEVDRWLDAAMATSDPDEWAQWMQRVAERFQRDLPVIPLLFRDRVSLRPRALQGWVPPDPPMVPVTETAEDWAWRPQP